MNISSAMTLQGGEYAEAQISAQVLVRTSEGPNLVLKVLTGEGKSRMVSRAFAYALEDLAAKIMKATK